MPTASSAAAAGVGFGEVKEQLIEGGYFRARIQTLTQFDTVAGGLAWGILNSRHTIDVEFVENAHIRDKIKVSENICKALRDDMSCPFPLEPHQIQGLDYPKVSVVLTWLLKRVAATREENEFFVREFTKQEFQRRFGCRLIAPVPQGLETLRAPPRVMLSAKEHFSNAVEHVSSVLLEYGVKYIVKDSVLMVQLEAEIEGDAEAQRERAKLQDDEKKETLMLERLLDQMVQYRDKQRLSMTNLNSVMASADAQKISRLREVYEARHEALQKQLEAEEEERNAVQKQRQRLQDMHAEATQFDGEVQGLEEERAAAEERLAAAERQIEEQQSELEEYGRKVKEFEKALRMDPKVAARLDTFIAIFAKKMAVLRSIAQERTQIQEQIAAAKAECQQIAERIEEYLTEGHSEHFTAETKKLEEARDTVKEQLREATYKTMDLLRKIDQFPTRLELQQYERRIDELSEEVSWKFEETRLMYARHNTQAEVFKCLSSEESIFGGIGDAFEECMKLGAKKSASQRSSLTDQIASVIKQIADSQDKQKEKLEIEQQRLRDTRNECTEQIELQKHYHDTVAKFKEAMMEYERLAERLEQLEQPVDEEEAAAGGE